MDLIGQAKPLTTRQVDEFFSRAADNRGISVGALHLYGDPLAVYLVACAYGVEEESVNDWPWPDVAAALEEAAKATPRFFALLETVKSTTQQTDLLTSGGSSP